MESWDFLENHPQRKMDEDPAKFDHMMEITGRRTIPQIFIGDYHVGGFDDLSALNQSGKLDELPLSSIRRGNFPSKLLADHSSYGAPTLRLNLLLMAYRTTADFRNRIGCSLS